VLVVLESGPIVVLEVTILEVVMLEVVVLELDATSEVGVRLVVVVESVTVVESLVVEVALKVVVVPLREPSLELVKVEEVSD